MDLSPEELSRVVAEVVTQAIDTDAICAEIVARLTPPPPLNDDDAIQMAARLEARKTQGV